MVISLGFAIFYLVRDNEVISISQASIYTDVNKTFNIDVNHVHKKSYTKITITSSNSSVVAYNKEKNDFKAVSGGVARINFRTNNAKFRNLWCDVIVGDGTVESPFYISTMEQLASIGMGERVEDSTDDNPVYWGKGEYRDYRSDKCYKLVADVNLNDYNNGLWVPLQHFTGRFDGNGMTINNMYINRDAYVELPNADTVMFSANEEYVGMFKSIGSDAVVYNLKFDNVVVKGNYKAFGIVAGRNSGTIERIEVKSATISAKTTVFGGIVGVNQSTQISTPIVEPVLDSENQPVLNEDGTPKTTTTENWTRVIARIDRCSISNLTIGTEKVIDENTHEESTRLIGIGGHVGGVVGKNFGGTVVYCYATGEVYFGDTATTYGGVVAENQVIALEKEEKLTDNGTNQGANIKDTYSNLKTFIANSTPVSSSYFGGVIGKNTDTTNGQYYDSANIQIVNNYIIGNYYNRDNLNNAQEGMTKNFHGIASFKMGETNVDFADKEYIVMGLDTDEMQVQQNFISHATQKIEFNEDGTSRGVVDSEITWLFGTVWSIDPNVNDGMPYLNYQLIYIPDDFGTVGTPVVEDTTDYKFIVEVEYPVSILSGVDKKITIKVGEEYKLAISPENLKVTWSSNDESIVTVDQTGKITGVAKGVAQVQVKTRFGSMDYITVNVEDVVFTIKNVPEEITVEVGATYTLSGITVTPTPSAPYALTYTSKATGIATVSGTTVTGVAIGNTTIEVACGNTVEVIRVKVVKAEDKVVYMTVDPTSISGVYGNGTTISGTARVTNAKLKNNTNVTNTMTYSYSSTNTSVLTINASTGAYTVVGAGSGNIVITVTTDGYTGTAYIPFNITQYVYYYVNISNTQKSLTQGDSFTLSVTGNFSSVVWTRSNTNVSISSTYANSITVSGQKVGSTTLTAKVTFPDGSEQTRTCTVTVSAPTPVIQNSASISPATMTLKENEQGNISITGTNIKNINWSVNNNKASLQTTGVTTTTSNKVTALSAGTATVTAAVTFNDNQTSNLTCVVTIIANQVQTYSVSISRTSKSIYEGDTFSLNVSGDVSSVRWSSNNTNVATVSSTTSKSITVTGVNAGTATITARVTKPDNSVQNLYCTVNVSAQAVAPATVTDINPSSVTINEGDSQTITATTSDGSNVAWTYTGNISGDTITTNGNRITVTTTVAHSARTITFTAKLGNSTLSAWVYVKAADTHISSVSCVADLQHLSSCSICQAKQLNLTANINMSGETWAPIGTATNPYTGSLVGSSNHQYTISNLSTSGYTDAGLFGYTKNATLAYICVSGADISGTYAGGLVGRAIDTKISNCTTSSSTITGSECVGGIAGYAEGTTTMDTVVSSNNTITTSGSGRKYAGGIAGRLYSGSIVGARTTNGSVGLNSGAYGYVGGIAGYAAGKIDNSAVKTSVRANSGDNDYAGGIVGYTTANVERVTVNSGSTITGYYAGGIGGALNNSQSITITFNDNGTGYTRSSISSSSYRTNVSRGAVKDGTTITGTLAGGLFGQINAGVVTDCYSRAYLKGSSSSARKGAFAAVIGFSGSKKDKTFSGQMGIVEYAYFAGTFDSTGTSGISNVGTNQSGKQGSSVHNEQSTRTVGFIFNYVYDKGLAPNANYDGTNGGFWFPKDYANAAKSSSEMQNSSTYTGIGFGGYWRYSGYPTLNSEIIL